MYLSQDFYIAKGEFDMFCLRGGGGGGAMIFSFDKSTSLKGGSEKPPEMIGGAALKKN